VDIVTAAPGTGAGSVLHDGSRVGPLVLLPNPPAGPHPSPASRASAPHPSPPREQRPLRPVAEGGARHQMSREYRRSVCSSSVAAFVAVAHDNRSQIGNRPLAGSRAGACRPILSRSLRSRRQNVGIGPI